MTGVKKIIVKLTRLISLKKGTDITDYHGTIKKMKQGLQLKGANLWILMCATLLTCVGLDLDSSPLLIGAMLISPLMNIVLAVGVFQGIRDWENLLLALRNLVIASIGCLFISLLYFVFDPYGEFTSAMMARSKPTLIDALIACVGGVAGIISFTRKEQIAALPGVAISITLMPPICTMAFGLAQNQWTLVWGAFYLFLINAIVIASAATLIVSLLGFPPVRTITKRQRLVRFHLGWSGIFIFLLPSFFFLKNSISERKENDKIKSFVNHTFTEDSLTTVQWEILSSDTGKLVKVVYQGSVLSDDSVKSITENFNRMDIPKTWLRVVQPAINKEVINHLAKTIDNFTYDGQSNNSGNKDKELINEIKQRFDEVEDITLKKTDKHTIAELEWKRLKLLIFSRRQKLHDIKQLLENSLKNEVTVVEV